MKRMKKIKVFLFAMMFCFSMMTMSAFGMTLSVDGLEVSLTTDKDSYSKGDVIAVTLSATNTNSVAVENVSLESVMPDGYALVEGVKGSKNIDVLESGDKVYLNYSIVSNESNKNDDKPGTEGKDDTQPEKETAKNDSAPSNESPKTGDANKAIVWFFALVVATAGFVAMSKMKKSYSKKLLSMLLCVSMIGSLVAGFDNTSYADEADKVSFTVSETVKVDGVEVKISALVNCDKVAVTEPIVPEEEYPINLSASKTEFSLAEDGTIYFYAKLEEEVENVTLIDVESGEPVLELVDDGMYSESGDDLVGDNIYTAKAELDTSLENEYEFYAVVSNDENMISNTLKVIVISTFTDEQLEDMDAVDATIQEEIFEAESFATMTVEERKELADTVLEEMIQEGLVESDSVLYSDETESYTFVYSSGVLGSIIIKDWNDKVNGTTSTANVSVVNNEEVSDDETASDEVKNVEVGKALILWSFNQAWDIESYRKPFYENTETDWEELGLDTTVNFETTVEDYKNLKGYDVIVFSGHGTYDTYKAGIFGLSKTTVSSLLLHEKASWVKNALYYSDLKAFRIGKASVQGGTMYAILPKFFEYYYDNDDLDGSFVFAENCEFYGKDSVERYKMSDSILGTSVESTVGFHNSVMADYSRELMKDYVENLIAGSTTKEAYDDAVETFGENDYFTGREQYGPTAYPIFRGNEDSRLINTVIKNGDFEMASTPVEWNQVGDTRVISKLGSLTPSQNKKMAILTTGIGSAEEDYLTGTEGSVLSQMVKLSENDTTLTFDYDYVSEEPMEYVGSIYNDTFAVQIISEEGTETLLLDEINTATWYAIDGINFDGGDDTAYHTGWKQIECDISKYAGQVVNVRFMVYDVGDSIYDSAVLLDAVSIK